MEALLGLKTSYLLNHAQLIKGKQKHEQQVHTNIKFHIKGQKNYTKIPYKRTKELY